MIDPIISPYAGPNNVPPLSAQDLTKHLNFIKDYLKAKAIFVAFTLEGCPDNDPNCPGHTILAGSNGLNEKQLLKMIETVINNKPIPPP